MVHQILLVDAGSVCSSNEEVLRLSLPLCDVIGLVDGCSTCIIYYHDRNSFGVDVELLLQRAADDTRNILEDSLRKREQYDDTA